MVANRIAASVQARSTTKLIGLDPATVDYAVGLIHQVCCFAGSFDLVEEFRDPALCAAVERHDTGALFDRRGKPARHFLQSSDCSHKVTEAFGSQPSLEADKDTARMRRTRSAPVRRVARR